MTHRNRKTEITLLFAAIAMLFLSGLQARVWTSADGSKTFEDNVKAVDARPFWRSTGPRGGGLHYNGNAETYMEVGNARGRAMAELLEE